MEVSGQSAGGQGVATDIIEAAAIAYVRALSRGSQGAGGDGGGRRCEWQRRAEWHEPPRRTCVRQPAGRLTGDGARNSRRVRAFE